MHASLAIDSSVPDPQRELRCLWLARDIPFPLDAGDRIYSAHLASALAKAGVSVRYLGHLPSQASSVPDNWLQDWIPVPGGRRSKSSALLSHQPFIAAMHATPAYQELLQAQLREPWDVVVMDGYGSGWALPQCLAAPARPLLVYLSHNHEERLWRDMTAATSLWKRPAVWQNFLKVRALERSLVKHATLVSTITEQDARVYQQFCRDKLGRQHYQHIVLTPGYAGRQRESRTIDDHTPRHVVLMGSFRWAIKQENLGQLLSLADSVFANHNIVLDVVGDIPAHFREQIQPGLRATVLHGFVDDPMPLLDRARMALVPEVVGGGFKLKLLDYVFCRIPVATLSAASAGIPDSLRACMIKADDLPTLINAVVATVDHTDELNRLQERAYQLAVPLFRWEDRGQELANKLRQLRGNL